MDARPAAEALSISLFQSMTALPSISIPRRPARPVSWVYSPGVTDTCDSPFHLVSFSKTTVRAGMFMPRARVSVANTALINPRWNNSSTHSLNAGRSPAWCEAIPLSNESTHSWKPRTIRSSSGNDLVFSEITSRI